MPSTAVVYQRVTRAPLTLKAAPPNPCRPAHAFYGFRTGEKVSVSSGDTTPSSTRRSKASIDDDEDFGTEGTAMINNVQVEVALAPSRFSFEYAQYGLSPIGIDDSVSLPAEIVNRILCMADAETRRLCRTLSKPTKAVVDSHLLIKTALISYAANGDIIHRILDFADHETRIMCRRLCRQIKGRLDLEMATSVVLTTISVNNKLGLHLAGVGKRRIPGLPPQSYDAWDTRKPGRAYANPAMLRHTRTLMFASNLGDIVIGNKHFGSINIGILVPYLNVHTVRDAHPGSRWRNPVPCTKYVTLTLITNRTVVSVPQTPDGVRERVLNISCPRDAHTRYCSLLHSLRLPHSNSVRHVVIILHFPATVTAAHFHDLALGPPLGVLTYVADEINKWRRVHFTIVGAEAAPPTVLGFETRALPRGQLQYELYQRVLPRNHTFAQFNRLKERLKFLSLDEYRAQVGEKCFEEEFIRAPW